MAADILIVDDKAAIHDLVAEILKDEGYDTRVAHNSDAALASIAERVPSLLILDIWLQGSELDGIGILEIVKKKYPELPVVMISGHGNVETAVEATKKGAYDFIEKPFDAESLKTMVHQAIAQDYENHENKLLKQQILERYDTLTRREKEVLKLLCEDNGTLTNQIISDILHISKRTVEVHRSTIMAKMLAHSRAELMSFCHHVKKNNYQPTTTIGDQRQ